MVFKSLAPTPRSMGKHILFFIHNSPLTNPTQTSISVFLLLQEVWADWKIKSWSTLFSLQQIRVKFSKYSSVGVIFCQLWPFIKLLLCLLVFLRQNPCWCEMLKDVEDLTFQKILEEDSFLSIFFINIHENTRLAQEKKNKFAPLLCLIVFQCWCHLNAWAIF